MAAAAGPRSLPTERLALLLRQLQALHGWSQTEAGKQLGMHQTTVGRIVNGDRGKRGIGVDIFDEVMRRTQVAPVFFFAPELGDAPDHRRFVHRGGVAARQPPVHLEALIARDDPSRAVADDARTIAIVARAETPTECVVALDLARTVAAREATESAQRLARR